MAAHSLRMAEKSSAVREEYNQRRFAGQRALAAFGAAWCWRVLGEWTEAELLGAAERKLEDALERRCFRHVVTEAGRVGKAIAALEAGDAEGFGRI